MHDKFREAVEIVLQHEGGLVDHPDDPGGVTNYGISLRWAVRMHIQHGDLALRLLDVDGDGDVDSDDIRHMPRAKAVLAYRTYFWEPNRYDEVDDLSVATKVFDMCVNMGPRQAHRNLQRALRACGRNVEADGIIGPRTLASTNGADPRPLLCAMRSEHAGFYRALIVRNDALRRNGIDVPDFGAFEDGWMRRAYS